MFPQTITPATWNEIQRTDQLGRSAGDAYAIPRESAEFLHCLILAAGCRNGLEVGASYGYSGLWIAAALARNGGGLLTIERDPRKAELARQAFARAGLHRTVRVLTGPADELLAGLAGPFDFVFLDADKPATLRYFERIWSQLGRSAVIVTDNIVTHAAEMEEFVAHVRRHPRLCSMLVNIGSGLELSVKIEPEAPTATIDGADWVI